jgi:hypothetical protein
VVFPVIGKCPVCNSKMMVERLKCPSCGTGVDGKFKLNKFDYLSKEQMYFVEIFIKNRGNIKEIEKDLGVSYPTVKRNLEQVIEALGYNVPKEENSIDKKEILDKLSKGEIKAEEALKKGE